MKDERRTGLLLLVTSSAVFVASAQDLIPAAAFFIGALLAPVGALLYMKGNRKATEEFERRLVRNLNPTLKNEVAMREAGVQAQRDLDLDPGQRHVAHSVTENEFVDEELLLCDISEWLEVEGDEEGEFKIETDVSFPLEVQERSSIADQIAKLRKLLSDGTLSQAEFEAAKARVLS